MDFEDLEQRIAKLEKKSFWRDVVSIAVICLFVGLSIKDIFYS